MIDIGDVTQTSAPCDLHTRHIPESRINMRHHVWPLADGGPDIEDNIIAVCPTGHYNIHDLLEQYRMNMGRAHYAITRRFSLAERHYAKLGYDRLTRGYM